MDTSNAPEATVTSSRPRFFRSLRWLIIGILVAVELLFGLVVEPRGDAAPGRWRAVIEQYAWVLRFGILVTVVWLTFTQLARVEAILVRQRDRIRHLYDESMARQEELRLLYQASLETSSGSDYRDILSTIVEVAARLAHARFGALAELDEHQQVVEFVTTGVDPGTAAVIGLPPTHRGLLGRLSRHDVVRIDDVTIEPDMAGFPDGHPHLRAFLGVPVRYEGELFGHLYVADAEPGRFTERDEHLLVLFAHQAAVAIGRARVDRERGELLRMEEQRRVASQLHDGALQGLYAVGIQLHRARRRGLAVLTDSMTTTSAIGAIERAMAAIRGQLSLLTDSVQRSNTWEQLQKHVADVAGLYGVDLAWRCERVPEVSEEVASALSSALAELVANAVRHGGADEVAVTFACRERELEVRVRDDGRGVPAGAEVVEGTGLAGARRRLERVGGRFTTTLGDGEFGASMVVPMAAGDG